MITAVLPFMDCVLFIALQLHPEHKESDAHRQESVQQPPQTSLLVRPLWFLLKALQHVTQ